MSAASQKRGELFNWADVPDWSYSAVSSLLETLKLVDPLTHAHCLRVGVYSRALAKAAGLNEYQQVVAEFAGALHDIGKIAIHQDITHKPGKLNDIEYAIMKKHPEHSEEIIKAFGGQPLFDQLIPAVRAHHERVDGLGYPDQLHGEDVPLLARVILIVDTLDAMGETRAYRKGMPTDLIYKELNKYAGTQFDASLVKIFLESHKFWQNQGIENSVWVSTLNLLSPENNSETPVPAKKVA